MADARKVESQDFGLNMNEGMSLSPFQNLFSHSRIQLLN
jgi:hypothetical protein